MGKVSIEVKTFGVCDFSHLAVTDWRLRRWRLWFLALITASPLSHAALSQLHNKFRHLEEVYSRHSAKERGMLTPDKHRS